MHWLTPALQILSRVIPLSISWSYDILGMQMFIKGQRSFNPNLVTFQLNRKTSLYFAGDFECFKVKARTCITILQHGYETGSPVQCSLPWPRLG